MTSQATLGSIPRIGTRRDVVSVVTLLANDCLLLLGTLKETYMLVQICSCHSSPLRSVHEHIDTSRTELTVEAVISDMKQRVQTQLTALAKSFKTVIGSKKVLDCLSHVIDCLVTHISLPWIYD
jgi:hypothetical protein